MSNDWVYDIAKMHDKFGTTDWVFDNSEISNGKVKELMKLRMRMLTEEFSETMNAYLSGDAEEFVDGLIDLCVIAIPNTPNTCLLYTSPSPRDRQKSRMPSSA